LDSEDIRTIELCELKGSCRCSSRLGVEKFFRKLETM